MTTPGRTKAPSRVLEQLSGFLDGAALFLVVLAVCVRPLFSEMAVGADTNILVTALILSAASLVALRSILLSRWPATVGWALLIFGLYTVLVLVLARVMPIYRYAGLIAAIDVAALLLLLFSVGAVIRNVSRARFILGAILATALCVSLYGVYQRAILFPEWSANLAQHERQLHLSPDMLIAFEHRVTGNEIFSTFILSNSLACFLLLFLPLAAAWVWNSWRKRSPWVLLVSLITFAVLVLALCLTKVKGAWVVLPVAAAFTFVMFYKSFPRTFRRIVLGAIIACALVGGLVLCLRTMPKSAQADVKGSIDVRMGYWQGALRLVAGHPIFGVGPGNFHDAYIQAKSPEASEVTHAHNGYLEVWSETGSVGLVLFLAFWVWMMLRLRRQLPSSAAPEGASELPTRMVIGGAGLCAFLFHTVLIGMPQMPVWLVVGLIIVWLAVYLALTSSRELWESPEQLRVFGIALAFSVVAFLLYSLIDFDMSIPGITWMVFALIACAGALRAPSEARTSGPQPGPSYLPLVVFFPLVVMFLVAWITMVMPIGWGAAHLDRAEYDVSQDQASEWRDELLAAIRSCPLDEEPCLKLGMLSARLYADERQKKSPADKIQQRFDLAVSFFKRARTLRPLDERASLYLARLYEQANRHQDALAAMDEALAVYPTMPEMNRFRGQLLEALGRKAEAAEAYRKALEYAAKSGQRERRFSDREKEDLQKRIENLTRTEPSPAPPAS